MYLSLGNLVSLILNTPVWLGSAYAPTTKICVNPTKRSATAKLIRSKEVRFSQSVSVNTKDCYCETIPNSNDQRLESTDA